MVLLDVATRKQNSTGNDSHGLVVRDDVFEYHMDQCNKSCLSNRLAVLAIFGGKKLIIGQHANFSTFFFFFFKYWPC